MDEAKPNGHAPPRQSVNANRILNEDIAKHAGTFISLGLPPLIVVDALLEAAADIISSAEPAAARDQIVTNVRKNFRDLVARHHQARRMTPGGIVLPS